LFSAVNISYWEWVAVMDQEHAEVPALPVRRGGNPLSPRLPLDQIRSERLPHYRFPNGVEGYVTTNVADFRQVLGDDRFVTGRYSGEPLMGDRVIVAPPQPGHLSTLNGPDHLRVRRLAAGSFSPRAIERHRPYIHEVVRKYVDRLLMLAPPADLIANFALPIPSEVIGHLIGVPEGNVVDFQRAAQDAMGGKAEREAPGSAARALHDVHRMLTEVLDSKKRNPGDDLMSRILEQRGDTVTDEEIVGLCTNLLFAGHDSTAANVGIAVAVLLTDPQQRAAFVGDLPHVAGAVEALIRHINVLSDSGVLVPRLASEDLAVGGLPVRKGSWILTSLAMANTDPGACPYSGSLAVNDPPDHHYAFGFGAHTCIGQHLARVELQEMLGQLFGRLPSLGLAADPADLTWNEQGLVYRMESLPVGW
jgi:cytochrome P450